MGICLNEAHHVEVGECFRPGADCAGTLGETTAHQTSLAVKVVRTSRAAPRLVVTAWTLAGVLVRPDAPTLWLTTANHPGWAVVVIVTLWSVESRERDDGQRAVPRLVARVYRYKQETQTM